MLNYIAIKLQESAKVKEKLLREQFNIKTAIDAIVETYSNGGKVLAFGNGGSAADAQHFAGELVGWYLNKERPPLEAYALTTDSSVITAISNDSGYNDIFARQVEASAKSIDTVVGISTSGNSANVIAGLKKAKELGAYTIGLTGNKPSTISKISDLCIKAPTDHTPRIQECHITALHIICECVENELYKKK